ncbi:HlyD family efflux transporter periplasmic adaptor subunit [Thalassomonas viridans]|uniref:HlyD family efflux transporter periplasmic adaptor subunit n=1 Tax=Thalassomonas viridans TaxID=137584 RepID=A0AAF0CDI6_9GAMM|nr:HlyD family efflux transporter periplasmic adaptor subunit [Thalassomonas viridans]WDE08625.1 HlyD family efflux transporter periplasmic adaptor subunit [Thalassomonas viridans]
MDKVLFVIFSCSLLAACINESTIERVKRENLEILVNANGELESALVSLITPPSVSNMWQYKIKHLVEENTQVSQGQIVVSFDDQELSEHLIEKEADLERAKKVLKNQKLREAEVEEELTLQVAQMQMEYDKARRRAEIIDHSLSELDRKEAQIELAIAENELALTKEQWLYQQKSKALNIKQAQDKVSRLMSEVEELFNDIEKLKVKAPRDGMVVYKTNWKGEKPAVGETMQFGQRVMEIADLAQMQLIAQINEFDSGRVAVGQVVKVYLGSTQELIIYGRVQSLGKVFRDRSYQDKRRVFDVVVDFDQTDDGIMRPGMTARVEVVTETLDNVLTMPRQAVKNVGGENIAIKSTSMANTDEVISVSHVLDTKVVIAKGLAAGDEVML